MLIVHEPWDDGFALIFVISPGHLTDSFRHLIWEICQFLEKKPIQRGWAGVAVFYCCNHSVAHIWNARVSRGDSE